MISHTLTRAGLVAAAAALVLSAVSCANPASGDDPAVTPPAAGAKLDFEGTLVSADYTYNNGDHASGDEGMVFTADTELFNTGVQSLSISGTSLANQYAGSPSFHTELMIALPGTAVDFTGKTVTAQVYLPAGSAVTGVNLTLMNDAGVWMAENEAVVTAGQWNEVSFPVDTHGYATLADIESITKLRFRFLTNGSTPASAAVNVNLDTVNW